MAKRLILSAALLGLLCAAPVSAQSFGFGSHFGNQAEDFRPKMPICYTDRQIREAIAARGFTNIYLNVPDSGVVQVKASRDGGTYLIKFDYCRDWIKDIQQIR